MLNFHNLHPIVHEKYSFVGIQKCDTQIQLCLPKGFQVSDFDNYDSKRDLFFLLYKVLRQFKTICINKGYCKDDRDGTIQNQGSTQTIALPDKIGDDIILYSKLDSISAIIDLYDELKILSLAYRLGISEKVDYSKIHKYLHACTYLGNGAAYIDVMSLPRRQLLYQPTDIVAMYCYILSEIKQQLQEEVGSEVRALADDFSHRYIGAEYSLFNEEYCTMSVDILKDALEIIDHNTSIKDVDYWHFYDAIELFLYGELSKQGEGEIWGVSNFYAVWESMCLTYIVKHMDAKRILHVDTTYLASDVVSKANRQPKLIDLNGVFTIKNGRKLVPDAVIIPNFFMHLPIPSNFILRCDNWDDYGYITSFNSDSDYFAEFGGALKIGYVGQPKGVHTIEKLKTVYDSVRLSITVSSQLPDNFYSYWEIEVLNRIDKETLALMKMLNHVFYLALRNNIYTGDDFLKFLDDERHFGNTGCVKLSVLRYGSEPGFYFNQTRNKFNNFVRAVYCLQIVDIKYFDEDYFLDDDNQRELKENSIRKQFVYEYLLQEHIKGIDNLKETEIKSTFWIPDWKNGNQLGIRGASLAFMEEIPIITFMYGLDRSYIDIYNINFATIVNSYFT